MGNDDDILNSDAHILDNEDDITVVPQETRQDCASDGEINN